MSSTELRSKTELTSIAGTENVYVQEAGSPYTVKRTLFTTIRAWLKTYFDGIYASIGGTVSTVYKEATYAILDADGYARIECNTTDGAVTITLPLMANNLGRRIEIALVNNDASADVVTISCHATDAGKLSRDLLVSIILAKTGDYIIVQQSSNSGCWEIMGERISAQLRLNTYAGYGSTDTEIMRFTNVVESYGISGSTTTGVGMFQENHSTGYHITAESGAANAGGLEITINRSGKYAFSCTVEIEANAMWGLSLNSSQLATSFVSITLADQLCAAYNTATVTPSLVSIQMYLKKGDIVRPHTEGTASSAAARNFFTCTYLG